MLTNYVNINKISRYGKNTFTQIDDCFRSCCNDTLFAIIPDEYPWYYELLLFNAGLWPWLFAKKELKKMKSQLNYN